MTADQDGLNQVEQERVAFAARFLFSGECGAS
jgi:hypothetical protein